MKIKIKFNPRDLFFGVRWGSVVIEVPANNTLISKSKMIQKEVTEIHICIIPCFPIEISL